MKDKINIALLLGGKSTEHEISLKSANFIYNTLDRDKYSVKPILINKIGEWLVPEEFNIDLPQIQKIWNEYSVEEVSKVYELEFKKNKLLSHKNNFKDLFQSIQLVFIGLHGGEGENGTIQALLEFLNLPYTGSKVLSSALAMNKEKANLLFQAAKIPVAKFIFFTKEEFEYKVNNLNLLKFPVFIKPNQGGSSMGVSKVEQISEAKEKILELLEIEKEVLVQELLRGTEVSCGVLESLDNNKIQYKVLYPTEIIPKSEFFDFQAKYTIGGSQEITPARISSDLTEKVREYAFLAHKTLGCSGYSRTDFIIQNNIPFILETNTLPGMTETSLIPEQAKYSKLEMKKVFDDLIFIALKKNT